MQSGVEDLCNHAQQMRETLRDAALGRGKVQYSGLRHTSSQHAAKHKVKAVLIWQLGGVKQAHLLSLNEEELCDREPFDEMHESMAWEEQSQHGCLRGVLGRRRIGTSRQCLCRGIAQDLDLAIAKCFDRGM